jgi:hypothetical protein
MKKFTFDDLKFNPHKNGCGVESFMIFPNHMKISVYGGGKAHYGDGEKTFEVYSPLHKDPLIRMTKEDVTNEMLKIQETKYVSEF